MINFLSYLFFILKIKIKIKIKKQKNKKSLFFGRERYNERFYHSYQDKYHQINDNYAEIL